MSVYLKSLKTYLLLAALIQTGYNPYSYKNVKKSKAMEDNNNSFNRKCLKVIPSVGILPFCHSFNKQHSLLNTAVVKMFSM